MGDYKPKKSTVGTRQNHKNFKGKKPYGKKTTGKKKPDNKKRGPMEGILPFMTPRFLKTRCGKLAVSEIGGAKMSQKGCLGGSCMVVVSKNGGTRKPIYVCEKQVFDETSTKLSMLFFARPGDYVIAESHKNHLDDTNLGCINIIIFKISKNFMKNAKTKLAFKPVFKYYKKFSDDSKISEFYKTRVISSLDPILKDELLPKLEASHLQHLWNALSSAIYKSDCRETTYVWYHGSKLADQFSK